jgi:hypothetical protein
MSSQRPVVFYGWLVLGSALLAMALSSGTDRSFGIAVIPLSEQFGWSRATLSTVVLITGITCIWAFVRNRPEDVGMQPYGTTSSRRTATTGSSRPADGIPFRQALAHPQTWTLVYLGFA